MRLLWNWTTILKRAWSVRFLVLAALFSALEVALPIVQQIVMVPPGWFALLSAAATAAALIARLIAQKSLRSDEP
jgi:succinate-acetate transporter protein